MKSMVHSGSKIIVNAHGLNESGSFYDASAFRDDGVQKFRTFSRADAQMGNGQIPFIVSFKQPNEQGHILTDHGVSDPIIQSVHQIIQFFKDIGSPLGKNQIILSGKSRGAYGTITAAAVVLSQPEVAATICLESPILDWAHSATALGSGSLSKQGFAASRLILEKILKSNLLHNSEILSYDMQKGLENLKNRLHSLGRSEVNIKIIKFINDATVGDNVTNQALHKVFNSEHATTVSVEHYSYEESQPEMHPHELRKATASSDRTEAPVRITANTYTSKGKQTCTEADKSNPIKVSLSLIDDGRFHGVNGMNLTEGL